MFCIPALSKVYTPGKQAGVNIPDEIYLLKKIYT